MRTFIAIEAPESVQNYVGSLQEYLRTHDIKAKWTAPRNCHFTLVFLGEQPQQQVEYLTAFLQQEKHSLPAVNLEFNGLNTFRKQARVLFIEYQQAGTPGFSELATRLELICERGGIKIPDNGIKKEPRPHLTVARFKKQHNPSRLQQLSEWRQGKRHWQCKLPEPKLEDTYLKLTRMTVFQSILRQGGAEYNPLARIQLEQEL